MLRQRVLFVVMIMADVSLFAWISSVPTSSIHDLMQMNDRIGYLACHDRIALKLQPFPLHTDQLYHPHQTLIDTTFVATLPDGIFYKHHKNLNVVFLHGCMIEEFLWPSNIRFFQRNSYFSVGSLSNVKKIPARVAVIEQPSLGYGHWMIETLGRLALLEMQGIEYDSLCIQHTQTYQKEALRLWGIDESKIINAQATHSFQADELIVPSLVCRPYPAQERSMQCMYSLDWIVQYVRMKFLPHVRSPHGRNHRDAKRIFISRKDARYRKILNEDDVFQLFEKHGFVRYELSKLSFLEQIELFYHAEIVVGAHGAGLTNVLFCQPDALIIELFQTHGDCSFFYLSQVAGVQHLCVKTVDFDEEKAYTNTAMPLQPVQEFLASFFDV